MNHSTVITENNKHICEAFGCLAEASTTIEVKVGHSGTIALNLCDDCVMKF